MLNLNVNKTGNEHWGTGKMKNWNKTLFEH